MSAYTCISCRVAFADPEVQRAHYKADWHRYNLKRKVAELPPVTAEEFQQRVLAQRAQVAGESEDKSKHCNICNKHFSTSNAYVNHISSKKHKEMEAREKAKLQKQIEKQKEKGLVETDAIAEKNAINMAIKDSLSAAQGQSSGQSSSAGQRSRTDNVREEKDMDVGGSDADSDEWEEEMLGLEECLFCSYVSASLENNIKHMTERHSFFIPDAEYLTDLEGLIVYLGEKVGVGKVCLWCNEKGKSFYTTKSVQKHMLDKGHCKILHEGDAVYEYTDFYDYSSSYPDQVEGEDADMEVDVTTEVQDEGFKLVLPSGASVGHRSLMRYYKQNLPPSRAVTPATSKLLLHYKALGWTGAKGAVAERRAKDLGYLQRSKQKHFTRLGIQGNKTMQHHYRPQVIF
ncbi:unnamed protein product [Owenia fusiformis]|uniref:C2H2-type domain-containing protein n=1 Tax=Owenia fusiformis TaxID=6347 RepID=A0A8S4P8M1_OWEFU|nr:unnamed protein product [Owenia fusiformis]